METAQIHLCTALFGEINWLLFFIATILAYALGALWYSPILFGKAWATIVDPDFASKKSEDMSFYPMIVQFFATALLGLAIFTTQKISLPATILFILAAAGWQKAGLFFKYPNFKTFTTMASIEVGYLVAAAAIFLLFGTM